MTATDAPKLDEMALRKPEFAEGEPIVLCDGQTWHLPLPRATNFYPVPDPAAGPLGFALATGYDLGPDYDALVRAHDTARDNYEDATTLLALAVDLLRRNYELAPSDFAALLRWPTGADPDAAGKVEMWRRIKEAAFGRSEAAE